MIRRLAHGHAGRLASATVVCGCLAACVATTPSGPSGALIAAQAWAALKARSECCYAYFQLPRLPLPQGSTPSAYDIDRRRESFRFEEDKAFVLMFELPAFTTPYAVHLASVPIGSTLDAAIFVPKVVMLDASFQATREFSEKTLRNRNGQLERTIFINPVNATERYLLIYGSNQASTVIRDIPRVSANNTMFGPLPFTFSAGADVKAKLTTSPTGKIQLLVEPLSGH